MSRLKKELLLALGFLLGGLLLLPVAVYFVGHAVFGEFPGGLGSFYTDALQRITRLQPASWFLAISPYLVWQAIRLTWWLLRRAPGAARRASGDEAAGQAREL